MTIRRSLTFLVLALALLAPTTAYAEKTPKPKSSTPKLFITLTDGAMNKTTANPTISVTFAPPAGTTAKTACKGKVTVSVPVGKKTVKKNGKKKKKTIYAKKTASLKSPLGVCTATPVVKIPIKLYGQTLKFTATFKGNAAVKKFTKSAKLLVKLPDPPPAPIFTPTAGAWIIQQLPAGPSAQQWKLTIAADGSVAKIDRLTELTAFCDGTSGVILEPNEAPFDNPFTITTPELSATDTWIDPTAPSEAKTTSTFALKFDSTGHATGTFRLTGSVYYTTGILVSNIIYPNCDTGALNIELKPGSFA